jgi:ribosomal protein L11 methyltransferase
MFELSLICPQDRVEPLSDALEALDALSVSVEDADAHTDSEQALFGEPGMPAPKDGWQRSQVLALYATEALALESARLLVAQDFFVGCKILGVQAVPDEDWVRLTQTQFAPVEITPEFWIVPTWHQPPTAAKITIRLDPGLAFGTGTHPTTRMCLKWIARHGRALKTTTNTSWGRVLDYGCGSGILAIGAAKWGAADIDAFDIDEDAVKATRLNAQANQVTLNAGLPDQVSGRYQVVLANILATPLKVLAPLLCARVAPGGALVLAGILQRQADELKAAYQSYAQLEISNAEDGWILMTARL